MVSWEYIVLLFQFTVYFSLRLLLVLLVQLCYALLLYIIYLSRLPALRVHGKFCVHGGSVGGPGFWLPPGRDNQYLLDPKVATIFSQEMQCECVVVFDKAHNIDNVCIEALSISVRKQTLDGATRNLSQVAQEIDRLKATDANKLRAEYNRLVDGLAQRGNLPITDVWFSNPALPDDILKEAVPGNIRRAEHFLSVLQRLVQYLKGRLQTENVESEGPVAFVSSVNSQVGIDQKMLRFCYDRLRSLMLTLKITDTDEFLHIQTVRDFPTPVGTYTRGFSIIIEPFDERMPHIPDPVLQLRCNDASLAIKPAFDRFQSVIITSGTLSPIDLYPHLLNFNPVISLSFTMSLTGDCICPMVLIRGSDQLPVSTKFDMHSDPGVVRNYGRLLLEMVAAVPEGIVCFFVSYSYMNGIVNSWNEMVTCLLPNNGAAHCCSSASALWDLCAFNGATRGQGDLCALAAVWWTVWLERNNRRFRSAYRILGDLCSEARALSSSWASSCP